jgi:hypothetical protein
MGVGVVGDQGRRQGRLARARAAGDADDATGHHRTSLTATRGRPHAAAYSVRMSSIHELQMTGITGEQVDFDRFRDQVLLIVNVASN